MTEKRFLSEDDCCGYYTEIIDNEKELDLSLHNPKKNLTIEELVDLLNNLLRENERLVKMLNNAANYVQREHREIPLDDFVEWWNNIVTEGFE